MRTPEQARELFFRYFAGEAVNEEERAFLAENGAKKVDDTYSQFDDDPELKSSISKPWPFLRTFETIHKLLMPYIVSHRYRIKLLEQRIAALEEKPSVKYCGVFEEGRGYREGDAVTWGGHLWIARAVTTSKPGYEGTDDWQLAVKRGRDGKDSR